MFRLRLIFNSGIILQVLFPTRPRQFYFPFRLTPETFKSSALRFKLQMKNLQRIPGPRRPAIVHVSPQEALLIAQQPEEVRCSWSFNNGTMSSHLREDEEWDEEEEEPIDKSCQRFCPHVAIAVVGIRPPLCKIFRLVATFEKDGSIN